MNSLKPIHFSAHLVGWRITALTMRMKLWNSMSLRPCPLPGKYLELILGFFFLNISILFWIFSNFHIYSLECSAAFSVPKPSHLKRNHSSTCATSTDSPFRTSNTWKMKTDFWSIWVIFSFFSVFWILISILLINFTEDWKLDLNHFQAILRE